MKKKKNYRILIAEDNQAMRRIMGTMLSSLGYDDQVFVVNGLEAWERIQEDDIDIFLCDFLMPEMNGLEVLQLIKESKEYFNLPFVMVTGVDNKSEFMKTVRAEVDHYVIKPVNAQKLGEMLDNIIRSITKPTNYEKAIFKGKYYLLNNDLKKSMRYFEIAEKADPSAAPPYFYQGLICKRTGNINGAESNYKKTLACESNYINALTELASIYKDKKDYQKLIACLTRASEIAPASFNLSLSLGIASVEKNDTESAEKHFKEASRLGRNNTEKIQELLDAYIDAGMIDQADDLFARNLQDEDDAKTVSFWNKLALKCIRLKLFDKARLLFLSALKLEPQNKKVNYNLAKLMCRQQDFDSAQAYLQKILRLYPDFKEAADLYKKIAS